MDGKGETTQTTDTCCCVQLDVFWYQPTFCVYQLCGLDIQFQNGAFNPLCNVCSLPPGWSYSLDVPYDGIIHLSYSGDCSQAFFGQHLLFDFCGQNIVGTVCYTLTVFQCKTNPASGNCVKGVPICAPQFCNDLECDGVEMGVNSSNPSSLTIDAGYPNPAKSSIRFDFSAKTYGQMTMTLVDLLCNTVAVSNQAVSGGDGTVMIDLTGMQPGAYYCVLELNGGRITRRIQVK